PPYSPGRPPTGRRPASGARAPAGPRQRIPDPSRPVPSCPPPHAAPRSADAAPCESDARHPGSRVPRGTRPNPGTACAPPAPRRPVALACRPPLPVPAPRRGAPLDRANPPDHHEFPRPVPYQPIVGGPAEGLAAAQIRDRLEQTRLARGVRAVHQVEALVQLE